MTYARCKTCRELYGRDFILDPVAAERHKSTNLGHELEYMVEANEKVEAVATQSGQQQPGIGARLPNGTTVAFRPLVDEWNYFATDEGTVIGIKPVPNSIKNTGRKSPDGHPVYLIGSSNAVVVYDENEWERIKRFRRTSP